MGASLRPCPFCGGSAIMYEHDPYRGELGGQKQTTVLCYGRGCGARIVKATSEEAAQAWNKRKEKENENENTENHLLDCLSYGGIEHH